MTATNDQLDWIIREQLRETARNLDLMVSDFAYVEFHATHSGGGHHHGARDMPDHRSASVSQITHRSVVMTLGSREAC